MDYYSGQGQLSAAKRNADGSLGPRFRLGNVPRFNVNVADGILEIHIEELSSETLELICGARNISTSDQHVIVEFGDGAPFEYELFFQGINTAADNRDMVGHFYRVRFGPSKSWDLIGEDFSKAVVNAYLYQDETRDNKRGVLSYRHREAETGMRLTNAQTLAEVIE